MISQIGNVFSFRYVSNPYAEVVYTNWYTGNPNNYNDHQHCVEAVANTVSAYKIHGWNDMHCFYSRGFVCERDSQCKC